MNNTGSAPTVEIINWSNRFEIIPPRNCWVLLGVSSGDGNFQLNTTISSFMPHDCFLITASEQLTFVTNKDASCQFAVVTFHQKSLVNTGINIAPLQMLDDFLNSFDSYIKVPFRSDQYTIFSQYIELCLSLESEYLPYSMLIFHHTFFALLLFSARTYFISHPEKRRRTKNSSYRSNMVQNIKQLILENYSKDFSLSAAAESAFTNPSYLSRIFKEETGMTLTYYLNEVRIENVKRLLIDTDNLIVDIAVNCGYNHIPHFNQTFKKYTGLSPNAYRKKYKPKPV